MDWVYGAPEKFLTDNGDKFANSKFIEMVESFIVILKTTAWESPGTAASSNDTIYCLPIC